MSAKQRAVEDIRKLGRMFKGLMDVASELEHMGSLEQATSELMAKHHQADAEAKVQVAKLEAAKAEVDAAQKSAIEILEKAEAKAAEVVQSASDRAAKMVVDAEVNSKALVMSAQVRQAGIEEEVKKGIADLKSLGEQIIEKQGVIAELQAQIDQLKAKFN